MSQHHFDTTYCTRPIRVTMGWDRPLSYFFMFIEFTDVAGGLLYSNLDDSDIYFPRTTCSYIERLKTLGIRLPDSMLPAVHDDSQLNAGNKEVIHRL